MAVNYKYSLIIGDFNINNSKKRRNLNNFLQRSSFSMAETRPTFIMPNNEDTMPDLILFSPNMKNFIESIDVIPDLGSEHLSIILSLNVDITMKLDKFYCFRKANMENINKRLENYININRLVPISPNTISDFLKTLEETVLDNTPKTTRTYGTHELPPFIISLIKTKRRMYREYRQNPSPEIKTGINNYSKEIHKLIHQYRQHSWVGTCEEINEMKGRMFYQNISKLSRYKNA
ncbi:hypothetical protein HHI36_001152, partial [Cryptolaemus montrouzieri]